MTEKAATEHEQEKQKRYDNKAQQQLHLFKKNFMFSLCCNTALYDTLINQFSLQKKIFVCLSYTKITNKRLKCCCQYKIKIYTGKISKFLLAYAWNWKHFVLCHIYVGFHSWSEIFSTSNLNYSLIWKIKLVSIYTSSMLDVYII